MTGRALAVVLGAIVVLIGGAILGAVSGPDGFALPTAALWSLRASRVALAVVVGAGLSVAGAALQSLLRNPLADPFVLGVSGGAAMGAALMVAVGGVVGGVLGGTLGVAADDVAASFGLTTVGAMAGAAAASALLLVFSAFDSADDRHGGNAVLVGVVTNAFSWAVVAVVRTVVPAREAAGLSVWLIGSLQHPDPTTLGVVTAVTVVAVAGLAGQGRQLTLLQGGDDDAARLGVDVRRVRFVVVALASVLVGAAVASTGVIGFIGLLVPHAVRRVGAGGDDRLVLPASALVGGGVLAGLDGVARGAFAVVGSELPVGALCALFGAPLLALLLVRDARRRGP